MQGAEITLSTKQARQPRLPTSKQDNTWAVAHRAGKASNVVGKDARVPD